MNEQATLHMAADEFLEWDQEQPDCRHELIGGTPVALTRANQRHDEVVVNAIAALAVQSRCVMVQTQP